MKWQGRRRSSNVDDRRGQRVSGGVRGPAMGGLVMALLTRGSAKTKLMIVVAALVAMFVFKISPQSLMTLVTGGSTQPTVTQVAPAPDDEMRAYLATMKADNEDVWTRLFRGLGKEYRPAKLVIYSDKTVMPGGLADARMGPFYMPANETVYIDPNFFNELSQRFGAPGDFAQAYVVAHEIGHHVQNLLGYTDHVHGQRGRVSKEEYNRLSVRLELQADFLAGVFAHNAQQQFEFLETGDIQEAMRCAEAIGDDAIQRKSSGRVMPDSFTHGTSEQRRRWFMKGFENGRLADGDAEDLGDSDRAQAVEGAVDIADESVGLDVGNRAKVALRPQGAENIRGRLAARSDGVGRIVFVGDVLAGAGDEGPADLDGFGHRADEGDGG